MRTFNLQHTGDLAGIGRVAEGTQFTDGTIAIRWTVGTDHSTALWDSLQALEHAAARIHATIVWHGDITTETTHGLDADGHTYHDLRDHTGHVVATHHHRYVTCQKCLINMGATGALDQ